MVAPGDDHEGQIGTIYELLDDDSCVCVKFSGDSDPYAFERDELKVVPAPKHKPTVGNASGSKPKRSAPEPHQQPSPGWYPDPSTPGKRRYWDGIAWGAVAPSEVDKSNSGKTAAVAFGVCVLVVIGLVMSMQSVSLITGSGPVWTGVAVVAAGTAVAFFMRAAKWVRVVAVLVLALSVANGLYIENQLSQKRDEISHMLNQ
ncbi:DUF2510 domain-containing protein [Mycobacterium seoulense]|uniref:DUF2510 domain-containing protein n=1 Tax=Mycobacterium seoulense TaxID=386911 RepID=UPI003CEE50DF